MAEKRKDAKLLTEFPPVTTEHWESVIREDLKGADYEKKLVWKTMEGINVKPYYRAEDLKNINFTKVNPGEFPYVRGNKEHGNEWLIRQDYDVCSDKPTEANQKAKELLTKGVDSLGFRLCKDCEPSLDGISRLLKEIDLSKVEINFVGGGITRKALPFIIKKLNESKVDKKKAKGSIDYSPLSALTLRGKFCCESEKANDYLKEVVESIREYPDFKVIGIDAHIFHNSGATLVQELAFGLSMANDYIVTLTERGIAIDEVAQRIKFNFAVSSNYFMEIAKFRAARLLWAKIVEAYYPKSIDSARMSIHAETSTWNKTVYDAYVNMLRTTTEGMSAVIAGVDSLNILPFDTTYQDATNFSERIARNQQLVLKEESYFDKIADPSAGSYYIENLTASIAEQSWKLFLQVEGMGGYYEAFKKGFIQNQIKEIARKRDINITSRRDTILGTNQYPNFTEVVDTKVVNENSVKRAAIEKTAEMIAEPLVPYRGAQAIEELRYKTDASPKRPKVFMLTLGGLAMRRARAQFSCNFFAVAGFDVIDNIGFKTIDDGLKAALEAKSDIVVICSSDDDYQTLAPEAFEKLGNKAIFVVAGEPACKVELEAKGIKNFISTKSNVLDTLVEYQIKLKI
ncbi:MAG: methylmalonyl-CoA mutase family protein [Tenuifilaceae bacterium]